MSLVLTLLLLITPPAGDDVWVSYELPSESDRLMCCFERRTCRLNGGASIFTDSKGTWAHVDPSRMVVYIRFVKGQYADVKLFSAGCAVDTHGLAVQALPNVTTDESITFFEEAIAKGDGRQALFAIAMHSSPRVLPILERVSRSGPRSLRPEAIFWLGQVGGVKVLPALAEFLESGAHDIQEKAVFAIGQIEDEKAQRKLLDLARKHTSSYVRKQALFWLGQQAERAIASTLGEFADDPDSEIREMAVFAISQRPRDESIPELIRLIRTHRDLRVREKAVFWLSQMDDPRALAEIERIIMGQSRR